jgi:hypothetical protein
MSGLWPPAWLEARMIRCLRSAILTRRAPASVVGALVAVMALSTVMVQPLYAVVQPKGSPLADKIFRNPSLHITNLERNVADLAAPVRADVMGRQLGTLRADSGLYDPRGGRWSSLVLSEPLVAGDGKGNTIAGARPPSEADVWEAVKDYLARHQAELIVDVAELGPPSIGIFEKGNLIQVHVPRVVKGIAVRDSGLTAVINHGNLILFGLQNWGVVDASISPALSLAEAKAVVAAHVKPLAVTGYNVAGRLERVPLARGQDVAEVALGRGYEYRLAWVVSPQVVDDMGTYEALVDALTGELLAFQDINRYAARRVVGGVYPVSNDQKPPDGVEQPGWPMPFADVIGTVNSFTTASGQLTVCELNNIQTTLSGQFVNIADVCGAVNENSAAGDMDLSISGGDDCTIPAGHSTGDTHSARSGFYELNRIKEQARAYLPSNAWLQAQLTANMNINSACNAFWNGSTVNFYRSNATCRNTGEIAAVFDHEWGHGMDDFGINGNISSPGEAIADIYGILRLDNSCMGRGFFFNQVCGGYGDPCIGTPATGCTGVRDLDFAQHVSGLPHGISWILSNCSAGGQTGPCGRETHCEGQVPAEAGWDLQFRDLRAAPFNYDENTALELTTRLMFLGPQTLTSWYSCAGGCATAGTCGCGATGGYLLTLGADDDNGNIADGTPHMQAIRSAFERHQIHCATQPVINAGCAGGPTTAPVVTAVPTPLPGPGDAIDVSWTAVAGAMNYAVYRTEGTNGCSFGKVKVAETANLTFTETGLLDGRTYLYSVLPIGANTSCFGLMSACVPSVPSPADDPCVPVELQTFEVE